MNMSESREVQLTGVVEGVYAPCDHFTDHKGAGLKNLKLAYDHYNDHTEYSTRNMVFANKIGFRIAMLLELLMQGITVDVTKNNFL